MSKKSRKKNALDVDDSPRKKDVLAHRTVSLEVLRNHEESERPECGSRCKTCCYYLIGKCDGIFSAFCREYED